jgi:hypothetical protein
MLLRGSWYLDNIRPRGAVPCIDNCQFKGAAGTRAQIKTLRTQLCSITLSPLAAPPGERRLSIPRK